MNLYSIKSLSLTFMQILQALATWMRVFSPQNLLGMFDSYSSESIPQQNSVCGDENEPWNKIVPSKKLVYRPCFDGFQCARVDLPMDWNQTKYAGARVQLAVTKLPAKVPVTDERYGGLVWLQSGGPGESGVNFILTYGKSIQKIVDSDLRPSDPHSSTTTPKYFDFLSIDSRGLNNSTPCFSCFPTLKSRQDWMLESEGEGIVGSSDNSFENLWMRAQAYGKGCTRLAASGARDEDQLAFHINTTPQIADMVAIIELHGKWREQEAKRIIAAGRKPTSQAKYLDTMSRSSWRLGQEKLQFWGFSYGTVLGSAFAAMQPHRVERVVLDGVVDTPDYYTGRRLRSLQDTELVLERLAAYCDLAGPDKCPLHSGESAPHIVQRFKAIIKNLKKHPVGVPGTSTLAPDLITYSDVVRAAFNALYSPIQDFGVLASKLLDLSSANGTLFALSKQQSRARQLVILPTNDQQHRTPNYASQRCLTQRHSSGDSRAAIMCSDANATSGMTRSDYQAYIDTLRLQNSLFAEAFAEHRMTCIAWDLKPKWRYNGSFSGQTAYPMLIASNVADPVTPIRNAFTVAERFKDSAVLAVDGEGHCTLSAPSVCAAQHIRQYFQTGSLPQSDTLCPADEKTFLGITSHFNETIEILLKELMWIARHWN